jgi:hypothetical protein
MQVRKDEMHVTSNLCWKMQNKKITEYHCHRPKISIQWDFKVKEDAGVELIHVSQVKRPTHWAILLCDVVPHGKTEQTAQFWQAMAQASELSFPVVFHTENCIVHSAKPTVSSIHLPTCIILKHICF